ncbi:MAG TPA: hypothetical protein VFR47_06745 [Anaerolineales bacterium]|nr:hypothetical protein [Anaerolineales bacterium]
MIQKQFWRTTSNIDICPVLCLGDERFTRRPKGLILLIQPGLKTRLFAEQTPSMSTKTYWQND